jgi:hypothetical protein
MMKTTGFLLLIFLIITGCGEKKKFFNFESVLKIKKTTKAPMINGVLDDECWKNAEAKPLKLCINGKKPMFQTSVRTVWDDKNLYVAFECQDMDAMGTVKERDGLVTSEEYVSVMIDTGSNNKCYAVINVGPAGGVSDEFVLVYKDGEKIKELKDWNCDNMSASVSVYGDGAKPGNRDRFWTVELAMPFAEFVTADIIPPKAKDKWRINFCRLDLTNKTEYSALMPTGIEGFNKPSKFSWVEFN